MSPVDPTAHSEGILGYHDPTLGITKGLGGQPRAEGAGDADGFFETLLDIINPLQHIPLVSNLYREITGDEISPSARILGGGLFGGPVGLASASANAIFEQASGDDILGHALAMLSDDTEPGLAPLQADVPDTEANIHQQADAGGHAGAETNTDIVLGGPPALTAQQATPVSPTTQTPPPTQAPLEPRATPISLNAPVSLAPPVTAPVIAAVNTQATAPRTPAPTKPPALIDQAINSAPQNTPALKVGTAEPALPKNWVNEALRDAATMSEAVQNGAAPAFGETKPWVGNAMLDALSKYEALTKARTSQPANQAAGGPS